MSEDSPKVVKVRKGKVIPSEESKDVKSVDQALSDLKIKEEPQSSGKLNNPEYKEEAKKSEIVAASDEPFTEQFDYAGL